MMEYAYYYDSEMDTLDAFKEVYTVSGKQVEYVPEYYGGIISFYKDDGTFKTYLMDVTKESYITQIMAFATRFMNDGNYKQFVLIMPDPTMGLNAVDYGPFAPVIIKPD